MSASENELALAQQTIAALEAEVQHLRERGFAQQGDHVRSVVVENSEHIDQLRDVIDQQRTEMVQLREKCAEAQLLAKQAQGAKTVTTERFVIKEQPTVQVVEIPDSKTVNALRREVTTLKNENVTLRAQLERTQNDLEAALSIQPESVVRVVEVEAGPRIEELVEELNSAHQELATIRARRRQPPKTQVVYVDREVYVEVPQVEIHKVEVPSTNPSASSKEKQLEARLAAASAETSRAKREVEYLREQNADLERTVTQLTSTISQIQDTAAASAEERRSQSPFQRVPRVPAPVYVADQHDPVDTEVSRALARSRCKVPTERVAPGDYIFGSQRVRVTLRDELPDGARLRVTDMSGAESSFDDFCRLHERKELQKLGLHFQGELIDTRSPEPRAPIDVANPPFQKTLGQSADVDAKDEPEVVGDNSSVLEWILSRAQ